MEDKKYIVSGQFFDGQRITNIFAEHNSLKHAKEHALEQSLRYVGTSIILTTITDNKVINESIYLNGNVYLMRKEYAPYENKGTH